MLRDPKPAPHVLDRPLPSRRVRRPGTDARKPAAVPAAHSAVSRWTATVARVRGALCRHGAQLPARQRAVRRLPDRQRRGSGPAQPAHRARTGRLPRRNRRLQHGAAGRAADPHARPRALPYHQPRNPRRRPAGGARRRAPARHHRLQAGTAGRMPGRAAPHRHAAARRAARPHAVRRALPVGRPELGRQPAVRTAAGAAEGEADADGLARRGHAHRDRAPLHAAEPHAIGRPPSPCPASEQAHARLVLQQAAHRRGRAQRIEIVERQPALPGRRRAVLPQHVRLRIQVDPDGADQQAEVREHMGQLARQHGARGGAESARVVERAGLGVFRVEGHGVDRHLRQAPQAAPDAAVRTQAQQHFTLAPHQQHHRAALGDRRARLGRGQHAGQAVAARDAIGGQRARRGIGQAGGLAARAHRRAQIHQPLRIGDHVVGLPRAGRGQGQFRKLPHARFHRALARMAMDAEAAREHALDVAVQDWRAHPRAEGGDGRRGGAADARQRDQHRGIRGEAAAVLADHLHGAAVQVARARVIAQPGPQRHHLVGRRGRQVLHRGQLRDEALEVVDHRADLGLLQHDLGQPDAVRIAGVLPRQVVPAVLALPCDDARAEVGRHAEVVRQSGSGTGGWFAGHRCDNGVASGHGHRRAKEKGAARRGAT
ncbi:conserved hypothetical protein [Cupriavidus taiwanensis]|nr:conserved hypothetical protein [Cupriavidus taiwanensis]SOZ27133.1 conserved hypothetical protein [Cupriavidus taiwanensis]SOZ45624.1 conserved hypothetical protein [Cupriavidus taiwanensis]